MSQWPAAHDSVLPWLQHTVSGELGTQSHWASEPQFASPVRCWVSHEGRKVGLNDLQVAARPLVPT
jgi:hypothetical protein